MKWNKTVLLDPQSEGGGGDSTGSSAAHSAFSEAGESGQGGGSGGGDGGAGDGAGQSQASTNGGQGGAGAAPAAPQLTPEAIAEAIKAAGIGAQPAAAPAANEPQYTEADFNRAFNVFQPDEGTIKALLAGGPDALKALGTLRDGLVKQAVTMAGYMIQQAVENHRKAIDADYGDVRSHVNEQRVQQLFTQFYEKNPDLKKYDSVVRMVVDRMKSENLKFKNPTEGFKALSDRVRETLKQIPGASLEGGAGAGNNNQPQNGSTSMPALSAGSVGAGTGRSGGPSTQKAAHAVFAR